MRALCLVLLLSAAPARAQDVDARLAFIDHSLSRGALGASLWWAGWMSYAAAEASYGWVRYARTTDRLDRDVWLVTGLGSSLWLAQLLIFPLSGAYAPLRMQRLPQATPEQRREALPRAERLLERAARDEREAVHWGEHVLDLAWAFGSAAYIYGRNHTHPHVWRTTGIELGLTILLTEAAILSTPRRAIRDWDQYRTRHLSWDVQLSGTHASWALRF
ncbi:MAG TPA: hypothetical protein VI299_05665 [Polyangiales bacterium]